MKNFHRIISVFIIILGALCSASLYAQNLEESNDSTYSYPMGVDSNSDPIPDELAEFFQFAQEDRILRTAVVLSDIYSKKDMEFVRGFLLGIEQAGLPDNSLSLKIINGEIPEDSLLYELEIFDPNVIFSSFEKNTPKALYDYSLDHGQRLINVFDARGTEYKNQPNVFQLISPSSAFNARAAAYYIGNFQGNILVIVGEPDSSDSVIRDMIMAWPQEELFVVPAADLTEFELDPEVNYVFYPVASANADVKSVIESILHLAATYPNSGIQVLGKQNWVAFNDLAGMFANLDVYIPVKCYFESSSPDGRRFIAAYKDKFGNSPIKSYPVYAVMGYDVAKYFLPLFIETMGNDTWEWPQRNMLQSYFRLANDNWFSGFYNNGGYMLHFEPWGTMQKILLDN